jgi:trehalose 6-phosphate phosphatase
MIDHPSNPATAWSAFTHPAVPICVFVDVDGMWLAAETTPGELGIDGELIESLRRLERTCNGAIALVSRRPICDIDALFAPLQLPVAGISGAERRDAHGSWHGTRARMLEITRVRELLAAIARTFRGIFFEDKGVAFALHYRGARDIEDVLRRRVTRTLARSADFEVHEGKAAIEIKLVDQNKGTAIKAFMREPPFAGCMPICVGSDIADHYLSAAVKRMNGLVIAAPRVADVRSWLSTLARQGASP